MAQNLILYGYKGCGKTYFGQLLAQELGFSFIDTDRFVEELYEKEAEAPLNCREISIKIKESGFRALERKVIQHLKEMHSAVIALGGGSVLCPENCLQLQKVGRLVYLNADKETIKERILSGPIPSFLASCTFEEMYEARKPIYEKVSPFSVSLQGKTDREVLDELKKLIS